ncbi:hypothetical protein [Clostridium estertheticum]|uniref:hypothetical protein n=1 Tax=Clostridium estertheticum TaxID=238834 RepID=UPI001CF1D847|nr:hypothetical protein [Clostridium estertheticum]MCB2354346.1 hypothetical protein [Clostridium estertheticum]WAG42535.1 hypothetical protein LL065_07635 [Clostridium estertheticum]
MKKKLKNNIKNLIEGIKKITNKSTFEMELVFLIGIFIIVFTNFLLNFFLGMYFLGLILIVYSIFIYKLTNVRR